MAARIDRYSRMVAWLKVILPLTALGLLSTTFLLSRSVNPNSTIPFAETEIEDRLRSQRVSGPIYSGITDSGDQISVMASVVRPALGKNGQSKADDVDAQIDLLQGGQINLTANTAVMESDQDTVVFRGDVVITNSQGYEVRTEHLRTLISRIEAETEGTLDADGPLGVIKAGKMRLQSDEASGNVQMVFTNGVKLIYDPKPAKVSP
ncbi:MAG: LPS export ABC transporter periplasmic protein LptC [Paracoccaceae bacterium]